MESVKIEIILLKNILEKYIVERKLNECLNLISALKF